MSTRKSTGSSLLAGRSMAMPGSGVSARWTSRWIVAVVLGSLAVPTIAWAQQPMLDLPPIPVHGDTLHHINAWDVQYGELPDIRVATLPTVAGPARTTAAGSGPQNITAPQSPSILRFAVANDPPTLQKPVARMRLDSSIAQGAEVSEKLASLRVAPTASPSAVDQTAVAPRTETSRPAGRELASRLASLPVAAIPAPAVALKILSEPRSFAVSPVAIDPTEELASLPVHKPATPPVARQTEPERRSVVPAPVESNAVAERTASQRAVTVTPPATPVPMLDEPTLSPAPVVVDVARGPTTWRVAATDTPRIDQEPTIAPQMMTTAPAESHLAARLSDMAATPPAENRDLVERRLQTVVDTGPPVDNVAPARLAQQNGSQEVPRPSYLDPAEEEEVPTPSYLETPEEQLSVTEELERIKQRVFELEAAQAGHEDATRTIIRQSFAEQGSNINDFVVFGGTLETLTFWEKDFDDVTASDIVLDTVELDFEIQVNPWTLGSMIFEYIDGTDFIFPTVDEDEAGVDRINIDTAWVTVGDTLNYPLFATFGRVVAPFGISTGDPVADVLTINDPLTVEVFETREDVILFGFVGPICCPPPLDPNAPPGPPPVKGILINPLVRRVSTCLVSYHPCTYPPAPGPPPPIPYECIPPFNGAVYFYNGDTFDDGNDNIEHMGGTLGYQTRGVLPDRCLPWSVDLDVDVNSSVFDSNFLQFEYRHFLDQIGYVPGMAAHAKMSLGPTAYVVEWNGALRDAEFIDDAGTPISIRPRAWQVAFAYQFGWNRSVQVVGAQGTYFTVGYSESQDLAGVTRIIGMAPDPVTAFRIGNVPAKRLSVGVGEWVLPGLRVALEYSHAIDYDAGLGTGNSAEGFFFQTTYEW